MEKRVLGRTGFEVSVVGLGGIPIQQCDQETANDIVKAAHENGINFIDTARGYTISEELLGNAIKKVGREKFIVATKSMGRTYDAIKADFETSYKHLGLDYIDLFQLHNVSKPEQFEQVMSDDGALKFLNEMKEQGLIKEIGVSSHSADMMLKLLDTGHFSTIQFPFNAVESQGIPVFKKAKEMNVGTIVMKPIAGGVLMNHGLESLRYILENDFITVVIPGMKSVEEVEINATAGNDFRPLTDEERAELVADGESLGPNFCRRCGYCAPCTVGIDIPTIFTFDLYLTKYNLGEWAKSRYESQAVNAKDCIECGICETRCPYNLPIIEKLKGVSERFQNA